MPCPNCEVPLDRQRDHGESLWGNDDARAYGVEGTHERCGVASASTSMTNPPGQMSFPPDRRAIVGGCVGELAREREHL